MIDEHHSALAYDWRTRFGMPLAAIGDEMTWREAVDLATELVVDPSSRTAAALAGWDRPVDGTTLLLMDLFDLHSIAYSAGKSRVRYPRPWDVRQVLTPEQQQRIDERLRAMGHGDLLDEIRR